MKEGTTSFLKRRVPGTSFSFSVGVIAFLMNTCGPTWCPYMDLVLYYIDPGPECPCRRYNTGGEKSFVSPRDIQTVVIHSGSCVGVYIDIHAVYTCTNFKDTRVMHLLMILII